MENITLLTESQVFDEDNKLEFFKKRGTKAETTDLARLLGVKDGFDEQANCYFTKSKGPYPYDVVMVDSKGNKRYKSKSDNFCGIRPVMHFDENTKFISKKQSKDGILELEYGYLPIKVVPKEISEILDKSIKNRFFSKTGNSYKFNNRGINLVEIQYCGKKYVAIPNVVSSREGVTLSDKKNYPKNKRVWLEVQPIKWWGDEKTNLMITEQILLSGVQFDTSRKNDYEEENFDETNISKYMNEILIEEMMQNMNGKEEKKNELLKENTFDLDFSQVEEEDILRGALQSGIAVFIHGKIGDGKTERVEQLDPDLEELFLITGSPESLNGIITKDYDNGEITYEKPPWLNRFEEKCKKIPDKIHILLLDEFSNAPREVQNIAFDLVLNKKVNNGIWKLPENTGIVATGNEKEESTASYGISEPMFDRFAHIYISTDVEDWLEWAITPNDEYERIDYKKEKQKDKIHPLIYSYIAYKKNLREGVLRTPFNGKKPNANPRKWALASQLLYTTKQPEMLRCLVGKEITADFVEFCKNKTVSIEDVIQGTVTNENLELSLDEKYLAATELSKVNEKDLLKVRNYVASLGNEILATFDALWTQGDEERMEIISNLESEQMELI